MTAAYPDSLHVGYRRKEFALAPIAYSENGGKGKVSVPSLLATIDIEGEAKSPQDSQLKWLQYFATGKAATALALRQNVRRAMIKRLDPSASFAGDLDGYQAARAWFIFDNMYKSLQVRADDNGDSTAGHLVDRLDQLGNNIKSPLDFSYITIDENDVLTVKTPATIDSTVAGYARVQKYRNFLRVVSIAAINTAQRTLDEDKPVILNNEPVDEDWLATQLVFLQNKQSDFDIQIGADPAVVDAIRYYLSLVVKEDG